VNNVCCLHTCTNMYICTIFSRIYVCFVITVSNSPYELIEITCWSGSGSRLEKMKIMQIRDTDTLNTKLNLLTDTQVPPGTDKFMWGAVSNPWKFHTAKTGAILVNQLGYSGHSLVFSSSNSAPAAAIRYLQKKLLFLLTVRQWPLFVILLKNDCFSNSAPAAAICYP